VKQLDYFKQLNLFVFIFLPDAVLTFIFNKNISIDILSAGLK